VEWKIVHIDETDSTNRWLRTHGDCPRCEERSGLQGDCPQACPPAFVVIADYQTAGRGCGTNTWESERGQNLLFSVLLPPEGVAAADQFVLSMANALALHDALSEYTDDVTIKWPNDIYWRDRKLCGTLIETTLQGAEIRDCLIGTGINVNQRRFVSDAPNPVSLRQILGRDVDRDTLLQRVLAYIAKYMEMVRDGRSEHIRTLYRSHLYRFGETHLYRFADGHEERCRLLSVTDDGYLELQSATNVLYRLAFKEVQFIIEH